MLTISEAPRSSILQALVRTCRKGQQWFVVPETKRLQIQHFKKKKYIYYQKVLPQGLEWPTLHDSWYHTQWKGFFDFAELFVDDLWDRLKELLWLFHCPLVLTYPSLLWSVTLAAHVFLSVNKEQLSELKEFHNFLYIYPSVTCIPNRSCKPKRLKRRLVERPACNGHNFPSLFAQLPWLKQTKHAQWKLVFAKPLMQSFPSLPQICTPGLLHSVNRNIHSKSKQSFSSHLPPIQIKISLPQEKENANWFPCRTLSMPQLPCNSHNFTNPHELMQFCWT